jgi:hypothetical protein
MIAGALGSALSIQWFFFLAWILISIAIVRAGFFKSQKVIKQFFGNGSACALLALMLFICWRALPKPKEPPTADQIADAIVAKMGGRVVQNQGQSIAPGQRPEAPTDLTATVSDSPADIIAEKVIKMLSRKPQH